MNKFRNSKQLFLIFLLSIKIGVSGLYASTGGEVDFTCPLCHEEFKYWVQFSYTTFGRNLDLKPFGAAVIPSPVPKCPNCHFVFNDKMFDDDELSKLKEHIEKENLFSINPNMPNYYYLAQEFEILQRKPENIAYMFLSAVWENKDKERNEELILNAIQYIDMIDNSSDEYNNYQLIKLDLLRRTGLFEEALLLIDQIKEDEIFYKDYILQIIELQEKLVSENDINEHALP